MKSEVELVVLPGGNLNGLLSDFKWAQTEGETLQLAFSFAQPGAEFDQLEYEVEPPNPTTDPRFRAYTAAEQTITRTMLAELETLTDIKFTEVADDPASDIRFGISNAGDAAAYAFTPDVTWGVDTAEPDVRYESYSISGDIWIGWDSTPQAFTESFFRATLIHELGHALGLSHPHESFYYIDREQPVTDELSLLDTELDQYRYTVMSYNPVASGRSQISDDAENTTFSQLDIAALQFLYGPSKDTEDDVFLIGDISESNPVVVALGGDRVHAHANQYVGIGDGGGSNTLYIELGNQDLEISLLPGSWSNTAGGVVIASESAPLDNLWLAESAAITNLFVGAGNDLVFDSGSDHNVVLGAGSDTFVYRGGDDIVDGGAGADIARFDEPVSRYQFSRDAEGQTYIKELTTGAQLTVSSVEQLAFSDDRILASEDVLVQLQTFNGSFLQDTDVAPYLSAIVADDGDVVSPGEAQLYRTYYGAVNRAPDQEGYDWWLARIEDDTFEFNEVSARFIDSPEFRSLADDDASGDISNAEFLDHVYNTVFGRPADEEGYAWWFDQLETEQFSQGNAFAGMTQSDEFVLITAESVSDFWLWMA